MTTKTPEERLSLIEEALFPSSPPAFDDDFLFGYHACSCDKCSCDEGATDDAIDQATRDGVLQALQSLITIAHSGHTAQAVAASSILLGYGLPGDDD